MSHLSRQLKLSLGIAPRQRRIGFLAQVHDKLPVHAEDQPHRLLQGGSRREGEQHITAEPHELLAAPHVTDLTPKAEHEEQPVFRAWSHVADPLAFGKDVPVLSVWPQFDCD